MLPQSKTRLIRTLGNAMTALALLAVPAFAIAFADLPLFSPAGNEQGQTTLQSPGSVVLTNWQFTDSDDRPRSTYHPRATEHPRATDHPRNTDHNTRRTDQRTRVTDHKSGYR